MSLGFVGEGMESEGGDGVRGGEVGDFRGSIGSEGRGSRERSERGSI